MARASAPLIAILILALVLAPPAVAGNCGQFFYKQQVVAPVVVATPLLVTPPIYYQAGRDIESEALAEKVARRVLQQLKTSGATGHAAASSTAAKASAGVSSALAEHCAKCHSGANAKAGIAYDGVSQLLCSQVTAGLRAIRDESMPKDHKVSPEIKGQLMEELLNLERTAGDGPVER